VEAFKEAKPMTRFPKTLAAGLLAVSLVLPALAKDKDEADVSGKVFTEDHKAIEGALVRLLHRNEDGKLGEVDSAETNSRGAFQFDDVKEGTYIIVASSSRGRLRDRTTVTVKGKDIKDLSFNVRKGEEEKDEKEAKNERKLNVATLTGQARYAENKWAKDAKVQLLSGHGKDYDKMRVITETTTDEDGEFRIPRVQEGDYTVYVTQGRSKGATPITINPKERAEHIKVRLG
jgi:hypothetical protein